MKKKIRFYKALLVEIIETLCTICLYLERVGRYQHIEESRRMRGHFNILKGFSEHLRKGMRAYINRADKIADGQFDDKLDCARVTKIRCRSGLKRRILRGFKKSMRQKLMAESEDKE